LRNPGKKLSVSILLELQFKEHCLMAEAVPAIELLSGLVGPLGADLDLAAASRPATLYGLGHKLLAYAPPAVALLNHQLINEG
jgi:hypothetical protein